MKESCVFKHLVYTQSQICTIRLLTVREERENVCECCGNSLKNMLWERIAGELCKEVFIGKRSLA